MSQEYPWHDSCVSRTEIRVTRETWLTNKRDMTHTYNSQICWTLLMRRPQGTHLIHDSLAWIGTIHMSHEYSWHDSWINRTEITQETWLTNMLDMPVTRDKRITNLNMRITNLKMHCGMMHEVASPRLLETTSCDHLRHTDYQFVWLSLVLRSLCLPEIWGKRRSFCPSEFPQPIRTRETHRQGVSSSESSFSLTKTQP